MSSFGSTAQQEVPDLETPAREPLDIGGAESGVAARRLDREGGDAGGREVERVEAAVAPRSIERHEALPAAKTLADEDRRIEEQNRKIRELEAEKRRLEREILVLPHAEVVAREAAPAEVEQQTAEAAANSGGSARVGVSWLQQGQESLQSKRDALLREAQRLRRNPGETRTDPAAAPEIANATGSDRTVAGTAEAAAAPRRGAPAPSVPGGADLGFIDAGTQPVSTLAVISRPASLSALLDEVEPPADTVRVEEILDAASRDFPNRLGTIEVAGTPALDENRGVLLVTAVVADRAGSTRAPGAADAIEIELDPTVASRYRLLASHARALPASSLAGRPREIVPLYRLSALIEVELAGRLLADSTLGFVRLRRDLAIVSSDRAGAPASLFARAITAHDLAPYWSAATPELRLVILASELARTPRGEASLALSTIRVELARLEDGSRADDPIMMGEVARLLALATDSSGGSSMPAARSDG